MLDNMGFGICQKSPVSAYPARIRRDSNQDLLFQDPGCALHPSHDPLAVRWSALVPLPPIQTCRSRRWHTVRRKAFWTCFSFAKQGSHRFSPEGGASAGFRSSVRVEPVTSLFGPGKTSLIHSLLASQESNALITLKSRETHPGNEISRYSAGMEGHLCWA